MATVTGLTADRMLEIEGASVISGTVDPSGDLILTKYNGQSTNAGSVKGPKGDPGDSAILPDRLNVDGQEVTDWNLAMDVGFYWGNNALNGPNSEMVWITETWWSVTVQVHNAFRILQTASRINNPGEPVAQRWYSGSVWSAWVIGVAPDPKTNDLNDMLTTGNYIQNATADATALRNYPILRAGYLEVIANAFSTGADFIIQTYTEYTNQSQWRRTNYNGTWYPWKSVEGSDVFPPPLRPNRTVDLNTISSQAIWGSTIPGLVGSMTVSSPLWVQITMGAWCNLVAAAEIRIGVDVTGATTVQPQLSQSGMSTWGQTILHMGNDFAGTSQRTFTKVILIQPGTTTLTAKAYRGTAGTDPSANYPVMEVVPLYWDSVPAPISQTPAGMPGTVLLTPTSIVGTGVTLTGSKVSFTAATSVSLNGVFSTAYDDYIVEIRLTGFPTAHGGSGIRMRAAGVDTVASSYGNQQVYNSAATTLVTTYTVTTAFITEPVVLTHSAKITAKISSPASTGSEFNVVRIECNGQNSGAIINSVNTASLGAGVYDGFTFYTPSGTMTGYLRVYGVVA